MNQSAAGRSLLGEPTAELSCRQAAGVIGVADFGVLLHGSNNWRPLRDATEDKAGRQRRGHWQFGSASRFALAEGFCCSPRRELAAGHEKASRGSGRRKLGSMRRQTACPKPPMTAISFTAMSEMQLQVR